MGIQQAPFVAMNRRVFGVAKSFPVNWIVTEDDQEFDVEKASNI